VHADDPAESAARRPDRTPGRAPARPTPPAEVVAFADARAIARAERDWARADALRARIDAAGWKVEDAGFSYALLPATPLDVIDGDEQRYGSAARVPSVLGETPTARFTVVLPADSWPDDVTRALAGLRSHAPTGTHVVVVENAASSEQALRLRDGAPDVAQVGDEPVEVVRTSVRLGHAAALNVGMRRARGSIVILADTSVEVTGDALTPLADALADPSIAVAGGFGTASPDMRRFVDADGPDVDAIDGSWLAFRRDDFPRLGPLDEKFVFYRSLDTWWSLVLRAGSDPDVEPRRAVRIPLPLERHAHRGSSSRPGDERERMGRRNFYRVLDRVRDRPDLLASRRAAPGTDASANAVGAGAPSGDVGDRPG